MFDPSVGRFYQEDPAGFGPGDPHLYRYVKNSPTNYTDPSGMLFEDVQLGLVRNSQQLPSWARDWAHAGQNGQIYVTPTNSQLASELYGHEGGLPQPWDADRAEAGRLLDQLARDAAGNYLSLDELSQILSNPDDPRARLVARLTELHDRIMRMRREDAERAPAAGAATAGGNGIRPGSGGSASGAIRPGGGFGLPGGGGRPVAGSLDTTGPGPTAGGNVETRWGVFGFEFPGELARWTGWLQPGAPLSVHDDVLEAQQYLLATVADELKRLVEIQDYLNLAPPLQRANEIGTFEAMAIRLEVERLNARVAAAYAKYWQLRATAEWASIASMLFPPAALAEAGAELLSGNPVNACIAGASLVPFVSWFKRGEKVLTKADKAFEDLAAKIYAERKARQAGKPAPPGVNDGVERMARKRITPPTPNPDVPITGGLTVPTVTDPKLKQLIEEGAYRPAAVANPNKFGNGGTADAIRHTKRTGELIRGSDHVVKGGETIRSLEKWLEKNPDAAIADRKAAQAIIDDIRNALNGK